jgi:methionyl-tRNA formyltransferase
VPDASDPGVDNHLTTAFAGSPSFAATILQHLSKSVYAPKLVLTQPDRPKGRGRKLLPSDVKKLASELGIATREPISLRGGDTAAELAELGVDVLIVAAYGLILPREVLDAPTYGCINVHASLLPRWRGAAPIERAVMAGDLETGVCIMRMDEGLDTGPVYATRRCRIDDTETAHDVENRLAALGGQALIDVLEAFDAHKTTGATPPAAVEQDSQSATYAPKLDSRDREVDWQDAEAIARQVRALSERLPATVAHDDLRVQLLAAEALPSEGKVGEDDDRATKPGTLVHADRDGLVFQCAIGRLQVTRLRLNRGKGRALSAADALNGYADALKVGTDFGA